MKAKRLTWQALAALASLCLTLTASATPPMPLKTQSSKASETETGYVISLRGSTLTLSNIPMGNRGGGGDAGPRIVMRSPDGSTRELKGEEARQVMARARGNSTSINVSEVNGKRTYTLRGPDGKTRVLTREEFEKFQKKMESENSGHSGGGMMIRSTDDSPSPPARSAQPDGETIAATKREKNTERKKVRFSRFAVTDQTSKPDGLARGTKVKVQYRLEGGKKIATKIVIVME